MHAGQKSLSSLGKLVELHKHAMVYVASPYTHYPHGHDRAYHDIGEVCWWLRTAGVRHYSPILYAHPLTKIWGIAPDDHEFWLEFDAAMMRVCDALVIVELDGWADSEGIAFEQAKFEVAGKPVYRLDPVRLELHLES